MTIARTQMRSRHRATGPSNRVVALAVTRSAGCCEVGGEELRGERGVDWSAHHRRPRQMGGTSRPQSNGAANLLIVCGSGTTGCHGHIESDRAKAYELGWLVHSGDEPGDTLVLHSRFGWCVLDDDGGFLAAQPWELIQRAAVLGGYTGSFCVDCGLPNSGRGRGDGLGSCDCPPACQRCRVRPGEDCVCDDVLDVEDLDDGASDFWDGA